MDQLLILNVVGPEEVIDLSVVRNLIIIAKARISVSI